jgi:hypothetical protein
MPTLSLPLDEYESAMRQLVECEARLAVCAHLPLRNDDLRRHHRLRPGPVGRSPVGSGSHPFGDGDEALDAVLEGYGPEAVTKEDRALLLPLYLLSFVVHHAVRHDRPDFIRTILDRSGYSQLL